MATIVIDGKEYEYTVLDGTAATYSMASSAVGIYTGTKTTITNPETSINQVLSAGVNLCNESKQPAK